MQKLSPNFVFQLYRPYGRKVDQKQSSSRLNSFHESLFLKVGPQLSTSNFHVKRTSSPARLLLSSHRDSLLTMNTMMGQSFHPLARASEQRRSTFDGRPQTFAQCIIDGKLNTKRLCEYKKRSHEEFEGVVSNSCTATHSCKQANMMSSIRIEDSAMLQQHVTQNNDGKKSRLSCLLIKFLEGNCVCDLVCCYGMKKNSPSTSLQQSKLLT